ncbi:tubulin delta chain [Hydra vulgaris]|nr:tubulin delta chain [Hydra vulgaris]
MSVVTVQLGQCGNQIGANLFSYIHKDACQQPRFTSNSKENTIYQQEAINTFFTPLKNDIFEAKAVLVDMESKVIQKTKNTVNNSGLWRYPSTSEYYQQQGSGNNWALGYHKNGQLACQSVIEICRQEVEKCDRFSGFLLLMSLAGGTGSGLGARISNTLKDEFPESTIVSHVVWPFPSGEVVLQNYNAVLTLSHLQQSSDIIIGQQNKLLQQTCTALGIKNVSMDAINSVASHNLASIFQPSDKSSNLGLDILQGLDQTMSLHPAFKLVCIKNVPLVSDKSMDYTTYHWPALLKRLRQLLISDSACESCIDWEVATSRSSFNDNAQYNDRYVTQSSFNKSLSNLLILRGKDLHTADTSILQDKSLYSTTLPYAFVYNQWNQCRVFNNYEKSATLVSNSQTFNRPLNDCIQKAWQMFNTGAFVHQYEKYGLTENDFIDSFAVAEQIYADYCMI